MFWPRNRGEGATRPSENKGGYWAAICRREEMDRRSRCWVCIGEGEGEGCYLSSFFFFLFFSNFLPLFYLFFLANKIPNKKSLGLLPLS